MIPPEYPRHVVIAKLLKTIRYFTPDQLELLVEYAEEMYHRSEDAYDNE